MININLELPSVTDWIVVIFTLAGVTIAGLGYRLAKKTVDDWKKQKKWDVILEALANLDKSVNYYYYLLQSFRESQDYHRSKGILYGHNGITEDYTMNFVKGETNEDLRYMKYDDTIFLINEKLKHTFDKDNLIKSFYKDLSGKILEREAKQMAFRSALDDIILEGFSMTIEYQNSLKDTISYLRTYLLEDVEIFRKTLDLKISSIKRKKIDDFLS